MKLSRNVNAGSAGAVMIVSVSVALLLPKFGSNVVAGAVTVAVLTKVPVAIGETVATAVKIAVPPFNRFTVPLKRLPLPAGAVQLEPPEAVQDHVTLLIPAGKLSVTEAPVTALGPLLPTVMV